MDSRTLPHCQVKSTGAGLTPRGQWVDVICLNSLLNQSGLKAIIFIVRNLLLAREKNDFFFVSKREKCIAQHFGITTGP